MRINLRSFLFALAILFAPLARSAPAPTANPPEPAARSAVLAVVQKFFDAMAAGDVEASRSTLLPDGQFYAVRADAGAAATARRRTHEEYLARLGEGKERLLERMWEATVLVHENVAMVWTPYDFHRDGVFSHGGVDIFTLVRTDAGWRIASLVFTVEPQPRSKNPAGLPPGARSQ